MKNFKRVLSLLMALVLLIPSSMAFASTETVYEVPVKLMHYSRNGSESMGARAINDVAIVTERPGSWHYEIKSRKMEFMSMSGQLNNLFIYNDVEKEDRVEAVSTPISEGEWINKFEFDRPGKEEVVIVAVWVDAMDAVAGGGPGSGEQKAILDFDWDNAKVLETREVKEPSQARKITITVNGEALQVDADPFIKDDRTMVPIRFISEALGYKVDWDNDTRVVTIDDSIKLTIDFNEIVLADGSTITTDVPAIIVQDRTFVPIRAVAETLGCKVDWNPDTWTVIIEK